MRPDIYAKGQDYQNPEGDVTGKITMERRAVERTADDRVHRRVEFSSTELINRHLNVFEPHVRDIWIACASDGLERDPGPDRKREGLPVLLVGDAIIDEYQYVLPMGKPPKENMIATRYQDCDVRRRRFRGRQPRRVVLQGCRSHHLLGDKKLRGSRPPSLRPTWASRASAARAPDDAQAALRRSRYMRKLFEVYYMNDEPLTSDLRASERAYRQTGAEYDVVISTDFGHGLLGPSTIEMLTKNRASLRSTPKQQRQPGLQPDH